MYTKPFLIFVWIGTLLASFLTNVIWKEIFGSDTQTGFYIRIGITLILLLLTFFGQPPVLCADTGS